MYIHGRKHEAKQMGSFIQYIYLEKYSLHRWQRRSIMEDEWFVCMGGGPCTLFIFCRNINLQTSRLYLSTLKKLCYVPKWCVCYTRHILLVILFVKNTLDINIFGTS